MSSCPTVRIVSEVSPGGFIVINESDFDASVHTLFDDMPKMKAAVKPIEPAKPAASAK